MNYKKLVFNLATKKYNQRDKNLMTKMNKNKNKKGTSPIHNEIWKGAQWLYSEREHNASTMKKLP